MNDCESTFQLLSGIVMLDPLISCGATKGSGIRKVVSAYEAALHNATHAPTATIHVRLLFESIAVLSVSDESSAKRSPELPDLPPIEESVPGYVVTTWYSLVGPKGMPKEVVDKLNREVNAILALPDVAKQLHDRGLDADPMTPDQLGQHLRKEAAIWGKVAKDAKLPQE